MTSTKCPACGYVRQEHSRACDVCGHFEFGTLALVSCATGAEVTFAVDCPVGQALLLGVAGTDSAYASNPQFRVFRSVECRSWTIEHSASARNPTWLNGAALAGAMRPLAPGDCVSIGPDRLLLKVSIRYGDEVEAGIG